MDPPSSEMSYTLNFLFSRFQLFIIFFIFFYSNQPYSRVMGGGESFFFTEWKLKIEICHCKLFVPLLIRMIIRFINGKPK